MSNLVTIEPTQFTNTRSGESTFGFRAYDDYGQTYGNIFESIPDDDLEFLTLVAKDPDDILSGMLDSVRENEKGIKVGETFYEYDEIKHIVG